METMTASALRFKTNIKCGGCIAAVTPYLNAVEQLSSWHVDTAHPDKILTVQTTNARTGEEVKKAVEQAGYRAERLP
jgi:copper chaperone